MRILIFLFVFLFAADIDKVFNAISKKDPNYLLDKVIYEKTKSLKFKKPSIDLNVTNEREYIKSFESLIEFKKDILLLPQKITEIQKKLSLLKDAKDNTSKLQYFYYQKLLEIMNKKFEYLDKNFANFEKTLFNRLEYIDFDVKRAKKEINYYKKLLAKREKEIERLKIDLQRWEILGEKDKVEEIKREIAKIDNSYIYKKLFENYLILWLDSLKRTDKKAFEIDNNVIEYGSKIGYSKAVNEVVGDFEKMAFGGEVIVYNTKKELKSVIDEVFFYINYPLFKVSGRVITPLNFAFFVLVLILGWILGRYYKRFIYKLKHKTNISHSTATLLANMGYYIILVLSFLISLKVVGLDLSSFAIIAGALSVGIGFGLQNIVSNFVSGIILMFERSIKVGDYIQIDENTRGEIIDISMRSTIIRTNDNINLIIPNQSFIQNNVINWTLGDDIVRFKVPFGVAYGSDVDKVQKVVLEALKNSNIPYIKKHPSLDVKPYVVFTEMADSSLNFELLVWVKGEYARRVRITRSMFLKMIYNALNKAGITIPFPQQDLHIKDSVPFEVKLLK